ncbi:hypothetical protein RclHR1_02970004 [Rhizophagus clarus]|uniref:BTB/POZ domain-containing protein n=1 Tax=Rhizophagus clarus TaxID=94130 RepID=A0A2Z6RJ93_9GLOM|nr:hypothetical protein RclHR1_02970004 [Rhizophagus clarus]GES73334.1 BTB/POZ domain-containing protein [Rhizophagus clarus]
MEFIKHTVHYYTEEGDIILQVENTHFLVHKTFLSFASEFFKSLFTCAKPSSNETIEVAESTIPIFEIIDEKSTSIEDMLSFIYPNTILNIDWNNVENLLRLSDKFIIKKLLNYCEVFLQDHFTEKIIISFILADKYLLPTIFKESSKFILDDIFEYECDTDFNLISKRTRERLIHSHYIYCLEVNKFYKSCNAGGHGNWFISDMKCVFPIPKPSIMRNYLIQILNYTYCPIRNKKHTKNFKEYFEKFEKLVKGPANMNDYYPFIELE